ncbi:MAG TPA: T9SS type A sorting domain-containing protein [Saprospiraceae bacterium]|nr:T9SS type A sorting domain-containing protein [Saprospiraceae bacterium]
MKPLLHSLFLCLPFLSFGQIAFEYVPHPEDFSIGAVRKSPIGEYFLQAADDWKHIYTSLDGVDWTKTSLPVEHEFYDIQYYTDGTPVLKPEDEAHLIRRNGNWYTMSAGGGDLVVASFIKDDTLFMYHDNRFAYSLDKGQTFIPVFTYSGNIIDHTAQLWKFESYYVLHHTAGTLHYLSVFNLNGERVLSDTLDIFFGETITYNSCGQILFNDENNYYLLKEEALMYQSGPIDDIVSQFQFGTDLLSGGGNYYTRDQNTIYKTNGCNFEWQFYTANDLIESKDHIWFSQLGEMFLYDTYDDFFTVQINGTNVEYHPDINYPYITDLDESAQGYQFCPTANSLFTKGTDHNLWMQLDSTGNSRFQVQYSPGGDIYVCRQSDIIYSTDNGHSFDTLPLPGIANPFYFPFLKVLSDNVMFFTDRVHGLGFYTVNHGKDWIETGEFFHSERLQVKLVGADILLGHFRNDLLFMKINVSTNEIISERIDSIPFFFGSSAALLDDGTFYIQLKQFNGTFPENYYRYRFEDGLKNLGPFPELRNTTLASSGNELYALSSEDYYLYDGETFINHDYDGLPSTNDKKFIVSQNEYLYVIAVQSTIYRSTKPLSLPVGTKETNALARFDVFPNPANNEIWVTMDDNELQQIDSYEIIDLFGRIVYQADYLNQQVININHLKPGLYNLILKEKETIVGIQKFIKL